MDKHKTIIAREPDGIHVPKCSCGWVGLEGRSPMWADSLAAQHEAATR